MSRHLSKTDFYDLRMVNYLVISHIVAGSNGGRCHRVRFGQEIGRPAFLEIGPAREPGSGYQCLGPQPYPIRRVQNRQS